MISKIIINLLISLIHVCNIINEISDVTLYPFYDIVKSIFCHHKLFLHYNECKKIVSDIMKSVLCIL